MKNLKIIAILLLVLLVVYMAVYRFKNPEKSEMQLFLDMITGKVFNIDSSRNRSI